MTIKKIQIALFIAAVMITSYDGCAISNAMAKRKSCCYGTEIPQGEKCGNPQAKVNCDGNGTWNGENVECVHYINCQPLVNAT